MTWGHFASYDSSCSFIPKTVLAGIVWYSLIALIVLALTALPAILVRRNLSVFQNARSASASTGCSVSLLIPARNEQAGIATAVESALGEYPGALEIIVMDDHSEDRTRDIVQKLAMHDPRIRLELAPELPQGWNGKQHACWQLAAVARHELFIFMDADVRLQPDSLSRMVGQWEDCGAALLSGFPRQEMGSLSEQLLIPMMYVVLLGYLPFDQMRSSTKPEFGAGCGQLFITRRQDYFHSDGHRAIRDSRHDGLQLPRAYRRAGLSSDVFDASDVARVRMYHGWREVVRGLLKNATEGIANSKLIVLFSLLLLGAAVLPVLLLLLALVQGWPPLSCGILGLATALSFAPRWWIARRLQHPLIGVWLHPLSVGLFVTLQWIAYLRQLLGLRGVAWRGRI